MLTLPPLSLYVHLPWCIRKCPYCDFNSHALQGEIPEQTYIDTLLKDLDNDLNDVQSRKLISIFIGGGTPSLFSATAIEKLLNAVQKNISLDSHIEITLEANPGTVEKNRFAGFRSAGINRLSLGIQSFQPDKLNSLGRIHNGDEAKRAIETAIAVGFENFNLDLMHGLPNQSINDALFDLNTALAFKPLHLSWYQLTLEKNTLFAKFPPILPPEDLIWDMQDQGQQLLKDFNFQQYEISAYSQPARECAHNKNYWEFGDYLGIGAGAHAKITANNVIKRAWKYKNPKDYMNIDLPFVAEEKIIAKEELAFEFMLNALRLYKNISFDLIMQRTGLNFTDLEPALKKAAGKSLLSWDQQFIYVNDLGRRFYNDLVQIFL